jgi:hypothetical protein
MGNTVKAWLARNWIGLLAVAVLLPTTVGITFVQQWSAYLENWPTAPREVGVGEASTYAGTVWALESTERITASSVEGREIGLPRGSDLLVARIRVEPATLDGDGKSPFCHVRLQELRGDDIAREWESAALAPIDFRVSDDAESICMTDLTGPYVVETPFLVPADAGADGTHLGMSLTVAAELPDYLRISLGR